MLQQLMTALALLANGVAAGVMFSTVIGLAPMNAAASYGSYVETIQFLWKRYDPFMPIAHTTATVLDIALAVTVTQQPARLLFGGAAAVLVVVMVISVAKNVPINRYVMSLDPAAEPADWARADPRVSWERWNTLRTTLALGAFVVNLAAVAVQL